MLQGVVDFLKNPDTYTSLGVKIPQDLNTMHRSQHHNPHQPPHTQGRSHSKALGGHGPPKILKNYFILCISIKKFKYLATKIEVTPPNV